MCHVLFIIQLTNYYRFRFASDDTNFQAPGDKHETIHIPTNPLFLWDVQEKSDWYLRRGPLTIQNGRIDEGTLCTFYKFA